jgi:hypothetical protein
MNGILAAITVVTWIAVVCALSVVGFLLILIAPWRWLSSPNRESRRLDKDIETRLLLGEDPEALAEELDARARARRASVAELHPDQSD